MNYSSGRPRAGAKDFGNVTAEAVAAVDLGLIQKAPAMGRC